MKATSNVIAALAILILFQLAEAQVPKSQGLASPSGGQEPAVRPQLPQRIRVSAPVAGGMLIRKVNPVYPPLARQARVSGTVVLKAIIGKDGSIENLTLVSGHPLLAPAAIEAVKQWKYRPFLLNGRPLQVETEVTVNFALSPPANESVAAGAVQPGPNVSEYLNKYPGLLAEFGQLLQKLQRNVQLPSARAEPYLAIVA